MSIYLSLLTMGGKIKVCAQEKKRRKA